MKLTKEKTNTIIVKAGTTDEYICCDFAIVKINESKLWDLYTRVKSIYKEEDGYGSYYNVICPFFIDFYQLGDDGKIEKVLEEVHTWSYIDITEEELESLELVEDYSQGTSLKIDYNGSFWFSGFGKYSSVQYETDGINIEKL